jgi:hypothetical protein
MFKRIGRPGALVRIRKILTVLRGSCCPGVERMPRCQPCAPKHVDRRTGARRVLLFRAFILRLGELMSRILAHDPIRCDFRRGDRPWQHFRCAVSPREKSSVFMAVSASAVAVGGMIVFRKKGIGVLGNFPDSAVIAKAIGLDAVQYQSHSC